MQDDNWIKAMQEELDQLKKNDVWKLVELRKERKLLKQNGSSVTNWMKTIRL